MPKKYASPFLVFLFFCVFLSSCSSKLGWGVLLWSTEEPAILSGTVLPVYIRSNIDKVWVAGVPDGKRGGGAAKIEIPLSRLELAGSRKKARKRAESFAPYALAYAENLQDRLPIRDNPDNNARWVYRLRTGEIVKILSRAEGQPAIGASGDPLPGDWYRVLTEDGSVGYCFSYRLKLFEHTGGSLAASVPVLSEIIADDPDLDLLLSKTWSSDIYSAMINSRRINLEDLSRHWRFEPGQETGIAHIHAPGIDLNFSYTKIRPDGSRAWRFEGSGLSMQMRNDTTLAVQFSEGSGSTRSLVFVALPIDVEDLIIQENVRRERLYNAIYSQGPVFTSNNYGTIVFEEDGSFSWSGFDLLVPQYIGAGVQGNGTVSMDLFLDSALEDRYSGAFTLRFVHTAGAAGRETAMLRCMYFLDNQGFRIETTPESSIDDFTVMRRAVSPMVLYFFRDSRLW